MAPSSAAIVKSGVSTAATSTYNDYVNPECVSLLNLLDMNVSHGRSLGSELFTKDGRRVPDFLSGYCVDDTRHKHPYIIQPLKHEMGSPLR